MSINFTPTSTAQDWQGAVDCVIDGTSETYDLTGSLVEMELRDQLGNVGVIASTADDRITITADGFAFVIPASAMKNLLPGTYAVNGRITFADGAVVQPFISNISILEGGYR
jgi:hypothetical protein